MPRYFFNLRYRPGPAGPAVDLEGEELLDLKAARERALDSARDMIARTRTDIIRDWFVCAFEIMDEKGRPVFTVPFSDTVQVGEDEKRVVSVPTLDVNRASGQSDRSGSIGL